MARCQVGEVAWAVGRGGGGGKQSACVCERAVCEQIGAVLAPPRALATALE